MVDAGDTLRNLLLNTNVWLRQQSPLLGTSLGCWTTLSQQESQTARRGTHGRLWVHFTPGVVGAWPASSSM